MQSCKFDKTGYNSYLIIVQPRRPPAPEAIIEEEEEEEDFFPRPSKYEPAKGPPPIEDDHRRSGKTGLPIKRTVQCNLSKNLSQLKITVW